MQLAESIQNALGGKYRIDQELEGGGMSRVFLATEVSLDRRVVVKVLTPDPEAPTAAVRFRREIDLTVKLQHPHILPILAAGEWEDMLYYITPYIAGESLRHALDRRQVMPLSTVARILRQTADALAFAHEASVVHRDVKPGNILLADGHSILADFGIARAVSSQGDRITGSGMVPGTPTYMAPELPSDTLGDIYALGMVGCEMLTGSLPRRDVMVAELVAARPKVPGESARAVRALASVLARAIAINPVERYATTREFEAALAAALAPRLTSKQLVIIGGLIATAATAAFVLAMAQRGAPLPADAYAVVPLSSDPGGATDRLRDALEEWTDLRVIPTAKVREALSTRGKTSDEATHSVARAAARDVGAGRLVTGDVIRRGDSVSIRATLFDVSADTAIRTQRVTYDAGSDTGAAMATRRLVSGLLRGDGDLPWRTAAQRAPATLAAWRAYDEGREALGIWDLATAESKLRAAIDADPTNAPAHVWLAQTLAWRAPAHLIRTIDELRSVTRRTVDYRERLSPRDTLLARALLNMSTGAWPTACEAFRQLIAADSADVVGWIGYGDCQRADPIVVRDRRSPSGWRFRSSYQSAAKAYERAAEVAPSTMRESYRGWLIGRLTAARYTFTSRVRSGIAVERDSIHLAAKVSLQADTISLVPYTLADVGVGKGDPPMALTMAAVERNRDAVRRMAELWVEGAPNNPAALDTLARLTELSDRPAVVRGRQLSALEIVRMARSAAVDSVEPLSLAASEIRLLIKARRFAEARALADSILKSATSQDTSETLAAMAALAGRSHQSARLLRVGAPRRVTMLPSGSTMLFPAALSEPAASLLAYGALGGPPDSLEAIERRIEDLLPSYAPEEKRRAEVRTALLAQPKSLAFRPDDRSILKLLAPPVEVIRAQQAFARNDLQAVQRQLETWSNRTAGGQLPGTVAVDATFRQAALAVAVGDTARAIGQLDRVLRALPTLGLPLLDEVAQAATLVRAFALRAELAERTGDHAAAVEAARVVIALWGEADAPLQPVVKRMRAITEKPS